MEDIRIGRKLQSAPFHIAIDSISPTRFLGFNAKRTRLMLSSDGAATFRIGPNTDPPTATSGIIVNTSSPVHLLRIEDVGPIICDSWLAIASVAAAPLSVIDVSLQDQ